MSDTFRPPPASTFFPTRQSRRCKACGYLVSGRWCSNEFCDQSPEHVRERSRKRAELNETAFSSRKTWRESDNKKRFHWHAERIEARVTESGTTSYWVIKTYTFVAVSHVGARKFHIDLCAKEQTGELLKEGMVTTAKVTVDAEATITHRSTLLTQHLSEAQRNEVLAAVGKLRRKRKHGNNPYAYIDFNRNVERLETRALNKERVEKTLANNERGKRKDSRGKCFRVKPESVHLRRVKRTEERDRATLFSRYFLGLAWTRSDEAEWWHEEEMEMYAHMGGYQAFLKLEEADDCRHLGYDPDEEEWLATWGHLPNEFEIESHYWEEIEAKNKEHAVQELHLDNRCEEYRKAPRATSDLRSFRTNMVST